MWSAPQCERHELVDAEAQSAERIGDIERAGGALVRHAQRVPPVIIVVVVVAAAAAAHEKRHLDVHTPLAVEHTQVVGVNADLGE